MPLVRPSLVGLSVKSIVTLVATVLFLLSLLLISAIQLAYVKAEMKSVLADQQHTFVARVADDLDQKLLVNLTFVATAASSLTPDMIKDTGRLEAWIAQRIVLRSVFRDIFVISTRGVVMVDSPAQGRRGLDLSDRE